VATITSTFDLATRGEAHARAASVHDLLAEVQCWLDLFVRGSIGDDTVTKP
jgi:hypothetical protein